MGSKFEKEHFGGPLIIILKFADGVFKMFFFCMRNSLNFFLCSTFSSAARFSSANLKRLAAVLASIENRFFLVAPGFFFGLTGQAWLATDEIEDHADRVVDGPSSSSLDLFLILGAVFARLIDFSVVFVLALGNRLVPWAVSGLLRTRLVEIVSPPRR